MNEEPKNFWRRPWKGWRGVFLWFVLLACAAFLAFLMIGLTTTINDGVVDVAVPSLVAAIAISLLIVFAVLFARWIFNWRHFRRFLFGIACFITLIALFYAEENWRGKHAWQKYKREWEAKGEKFDVASLAPPPVPDDQNFAMQPIWVEEISGMMGMEKARTWYGKRVDALGHTNPVRSLEMPIEGRGLDFTNGSWNWQKSERTDLKKWQEYYRWLASITNVFRLSLASVTNVFPVASQSQTPAEAVLFALSKYDSTIEKLRAASKLRYARFPVGYTDDNPYTILLPHLASLKGCTQVLRLRAIGELQADQTEKALDDIKLMVRLTESVRTEPILISHLVHIAMLNFTMQPVWEGLADHKWNDTQLAALEAELGKLDLLADFEFSMRGERAFGVACVDYLRRNPNQIRNMESFDAQDHPRNSFLEELASSIMPRLIPSGWFGQNKVSICRMHEQYLLPVINLETRTFSTAAARRADEACEKIPSTPNNWFSGMLLPALMKTSAKSSRAQSSLDMARIAVALERYRLAQGNFPETLDALKPKFMEKIPHDVIGGQPLKYHRTDDGQFILYSVGWNETDDNGKVGLTKLGNPDPNQGDWVWRYPAK